jgi:hypothetical protein
MQALASLTLAIHLLWILWVIVGAFFTRGRPFLTTFHILSLLWGIVVELSPLPCPLTLTEQFFEQTAGAQVYQGPFLPHLLERIVYPDLSTALLVGLGVAVCLVNLAVYVVRFWRRPPRRPQAEPRQNGADTQ